MRNFLEIFIYIFYIILPIRTYLFKINIYVYFNVLVKNINEINEIRQKKEFQIQTLIKLLTTNGRRRQCSMKSIKKNIIIIIKEVGVYKVFQYFI